MILKIRFKIILWILLLVIAGFAVYLIIERQKMLNFILPEIKEITLLKADISQDTALIEMHAIVVNKAPYAMNIDSIICDLSLGGTHLVSTSQYVGLRQQSGGTDSVVFSAKLPISRTRNKIQSLQSQDSTGIGLSVTIVYSTRKLSFNHSEKIEVPVPPKFKVVKTERKELKLFKKDVKVDLFLQVINEGKNLSLDIHDLQYEMVIGDDLRTKGKFGKDVSIQPGSSQMLRFPLDFKMNQPLKTVMKIWSDQDRVPFRMMLSGYLDVGKMKRIPTVIYASGKLELVNEEKKRAEKKEEREEKKESRQERKEEKKEQRKARKEEKQG